MRKGIYWLLIFCCCLPWGVNAEVLRCKVCSKRIANRYIKGSDGNAYCNKKCFEKTLPRCKHCKKVCRNGAFKVKELFYCSKDCAEKIASCVVKEPCLNKTIIIGSAKTISPIAAGNVSNKT